MNYATKQEAVQEGLKQTKCKHPNTKPIWDATDLVHLQVDHEGHMRFAVFKVRDDEGFHFELSIFEQKKCNA